MFTFSNINNFLSAFKIWKNILSQITLLKFASLMLFPRICLFSMHKNSNATFFESEKYKFLGIKKMRQSSYVCASYVCCVQTRVRGGGVLFCVLPSISSTSYAQIFRTKVFFWQLFLVTFWLWQKLCTKNSRVKCWWNRHLVSSAALDAARFIFVTRESFGTILEWK